MIGHEINQQGESSRLHPGRQCLKLLDPLRGIVGVVRTHIKVVPYGIRAACNALEQVRVIRWLVQIAVVGCRRLLEDARQPDVGEPVGAEFFQNTRTQVAELSRAVHRQSAIGCSCIVLITKQTRKHLVNARLHSECPVAPAQFQRAIRPHLIISREINIPSGRTVEVLVPLGFDPVSGCAEPLHRARFCRTRQLLKTHKQAPFLAGETDAL